ncbi:THAP domain-containing protein 5-like isoform X2 [Lutzomyia longipalpis]|uniref:Putative 52 kDa repressor of the inhibitor of the protein kinase n=1 Tax=Lutzomyia longipalpis TaxID=7200 RepID=A0A1B0CB98_LUTLO|nr:THAP domain-containing protein 5-like isoform X2 [Lutzomyia longipalpis]XP_055681656.1 THAP domain-containing protein 5-like isoform X2 [Lutzomyia longipalpis]
MSGICCVTSCRKRLERNKRNVKSFSFPNDTKRRKLWVQAIQSVQKNWVPSAFNRICNEHFKQNDFYTSEKTKELLLKTNAVPSIFHVSDHVEVVERRPLRSAKSSSITSPTIKHENEASSFNEDDIIENDPGTEVGNPTVIEEYIIEQDPLTGNTEYKFSGTTTKFYGQVEASDSEEDMGQETIEEVHGDDDTSLTLKLSKLISEENISSACAEKLLSILKQHGHAELPKKSEELHPEIVEPENEEIEHMNKVLDYVVAEAKDIEAKIQFKLNFLSKCLNRIECKVQALAVRPIVTAGKDFYPVSTTFTSLFPIDSIEKLTEVEEKIDEDESMEANIRSVLSSHPRTWMKRMFSDELMEQFNLNGSGNKGNFMELKIVKIIEKFVSRGDILHQKRQCKDRYRKGKLYKSRKMENEEIY